MRQLPSNYPSRIARTRIKLWKIELNETYLTPHAAQRLGERTSLSPSELIRILSTDNLVSLGVELGTKRESKLFFSKFDDKFFVAIQDTCDGYVVTVLTLEYWHNLSEKHFFEKRIVSKQELLNAIMVSDPENLICQHPPILGNKTLAISLILQSQRVLNAGSIDIEALLSDSILDLTKTLKNQFGQKLQAKELHEERITGALWRLKNEQNPHGIRFNHDIEYENFIGAMKQDLLKRKALFKKYEDFSEVLNRRKEMNYYMDRDS